MKRFLFLVASAFLFTNIVASEEGLLCTWAIFRTVHVKADTVDYNARYFKEEKFATYIGRPVCEKIAVGKYDTQALRTLIGFLGKDGTRYTCKPFPELQKNEILLISSEFDEVSKAFFVKKEQEKRCLGCLGGRRRGFLEVGGVELEEETRA